MFRVRQHHRSDRRDAGAGGDEQQFATIAASLHESITALSDRLAAERIAPGGIGQEAMEYGRVTERPV